MIESVPMTVATPTRRLIKLDQVMSLTGLGHSYIYDKMSKGEFPAAVRLGRGIAVAWYEDEIQAWINSRPRATRPGAPVWQPPAADAAAADPPAEPAVQPAAVDGPRMSKYGRHLGRPARKS
ncbi:transcriptional regulator, AlpA family [Variovorax sp. HW608]|uniref:helix-turn-helix transcriptional regulator n=1 Tax=Variovorax sp. HW608 TaxID=1034889 RepID=UPI00081FB4F9|nr:AlpA family phage regulatory protein [Variovorax sp. HW608]SCK49520.1 transcriptional regulator, AlpA family [Variovorax sp. HW608]